jgi:hypothetical protein
MLGEEYKLFNAEVNNGGALTSLLHISRIHPEQKELFGSVK